MLETIPRYDAWKTLSQPEEDVNMATLLDQCRPCPFCGPGCVAVEIDIWSDEVSVIYDCKARGPVSDSMEEAVERANRRRNA